MTLTREQIRLLLHFQWLQGVSYTDAAKKIRDLYGETTSRKTAYNWYRKFDEEDMELKDKQRSGRPREIDREAVIRAIEANPTMTTRMLGNDFECDQKFIVGTLHEAGNVLGFGSSFAVLRPKVEKDALGAASADGRSEAEESRGGNGVARAPASRAVLAQCHNYGRDLAVL
jgi:hypothetical protein